MSYTPTEWKSGDIVSSQKLNNIEDGIVNANSSISNLSQTVQTMGGQITSLSQTQTGGGSSPLFHIAIGSETANLVPIWPNGEEVQGTSKVYYTSTDGVSDNGINNDASTVFQTTDPDCEAFLTAAYSALSNGLPFGPQKYPVFSFVTPNSDVNYVQISAPDYSYGVAIVGPANYGDLNPYNQLADNMSTLDAETAGIIVSDSVSGRVYLIVPEDIGVVPLEQFAGE